MINTSTNCGLKKLTNTWIIDRYNLHWEYKIILSTAPSKQKDDGRIVQYKGASCVYCVHTKREESKEDEEGIPLCYSKVSGLYHKWKNKLIVYHLKSQAPIS